MRKTKFIACILCLLILAGCGGSDGSLIGEWTRTEEFLPGREFTISREFNADGTIIETSDMFGLMQHVGTYTINGDKLVIVMTHVINEKGEKVDMSIEIDYEFQYYFKGNNLILVDLSFDVHEEMIHTRTK
jgi:hypothetical protein